MQAVTIAWALDKEPPQSLFSLLKFTHQLPQQLERATLLVKKNNPIYLASRNTVALLLSLVMLAACATQPTSANRSMSSGLTFATPESVGVDSDRLDRLTQAMQGFVDDGRLAGVVTAAARDGKIIHFESVGQRDIAAGSPMTEDALFRIYSMTKPITGVAMMMLYERGLFKLSDPVSMYIPEFADLQVYAGMDDDGNMITEAPAHPMTVRELMNHTGGLTYGLFSQSPVDDLYNAAGVLDPASNLQDMIDKLAKIPLRQQPGSLWHYSVSVDVQGYMVEKLSGQRFSDFLGGQYLRTARHGRHRLFRSSRKSGPIS